jgi:tRNA A-37 threonylcarbamoyl transferase component Bud32
MADPSFYDAMHSEATAGTSFRVVERDLPEGWRRYEQDDWFVIDPQTGGLPMQGWKIHASATQGNAEHVLETVWDYCVPRKIEFKFLRSPNALTSRVAKYAARGYSGKLVTIYPVDDVECEKILRELGELLDGEPNPYILSDLRWGKGPLFVRYGAFVNQFTVNEAGRVVSAIRDGDGQLVPDRRDPVFYIPPWVTLPDFLAPHLAARNAVTVADLPYTIERVVHFSNGGGIYVGHDKNTGTEVVLKEGRPHAGLDAQGHDAVYRVEREHEILTLLADIPGVPAVHDLFWLGEHRFLVMDFVDGDVLGKAIVKRYPLIDPEAGPAEYREYTEWATHIQEQLEETLAAVHERGVVYGDLHLFNVVVKEDDTIALLDYEVAALREEDIRPGLGNPGFFAPRTNTGFDIDRYSLACMRLALFLPMTNLLGLHRVKAREFAEIITENFPVAPEFLAKAVDFIVPPDTPKLARPRIEPDPAEWPELRDGLVRAIVASATPDRDDRLFPGDIEQFATGGLGLGYGAAGVLYAISATGGGRFPQFEEWLVSRATKPATGTRLGLYDGLHGAAFALGELGYRQEALDILDIGLRENWEKLSSDLGGGLAGIGLNLLHFADETGEPALREAALRAAGLVADRLGEVPDDDAPTISGGENPYAGLMRGWSGQALLLLRAYDDTGDTAFLDRAAVALRQDLRCCVFRENGSLEVNEGWRSMPYLGTGSTGVGLVLGDYLARRHDDQFAEAFAGAERAARSRMYILPGLFNGRAGILYHRVRTSADPLTDPQVAKQIRNLAWHALPYGDGMAFPGNEMLRLSMDLATGTAGVLLALGSALHDQPVTIPLVSPARKPATPQTPAPTGVGQ